MPVSLAPGSAEPVGRSIASINTKAPTDRFCVNADLNLTPSRAPDAAADIQRALRELAALSHDVKKR